LQNYNTDIIELLVFEFLYISNSLKSTFRIPKSKLNLTIYGKNPKYGDNLLNRNTTPISQISLPSPLTLPFQHLTELDYLIGIIVVQYNNIVFSIENHKSVKNL